jgi:hypothetical protein
LEREVEAGERFDSGEPRHDEGGLDAAIFSQHQFFCEQGIDRLDCSDLALLNATQGDIEDFDRPRHLETDHRLFDTINKRGNDLDTNAHRSPPFASRRAMAS